MGKRVWEWADAMKNLVIMCACGGEKCGPALQFGNIAGSAESRAAAGGLPQTPAL
jgi:hypothetical protein